MLPLNTETKDAPSGFRRKIALFYKGCPYPAESGLQRRVLELINGFAQLGAEVTLFSTKSQSETPWKEESIRWLREHGVADVKVYENTRLDRFFYRILAKLDIWRGRQTPLLSINYTPPGMCWWLARQLRAMSPHVTVMIYAMWDRLLAGSRNVAGVQVIDTIDLVSINAKMRRALQQTMSVTPEGFDHFETVALDEHFYQRLGLLPDANEFLIYDRYHYTLAISESEAETIRQHTQKTRVIYLPMTEETRHMKNSYDREALFTMGENVFNRQACHYFVHRVLPTVLNRAPDFQLAITGTGHPSLPPQSHVKHLGFIPDLQELYRRARFLVCPVFGGTGQMIKVVEAMAHGLPVVILESATNRARIEHGVDGFIARNAQEFGEYVSLLWNDQELCHRLGQAARESVKNNFSRARLLDALSMIIKSGRAKT